MSLELALNLAQTALKTARERTFSPLAVTVLDAGARPIVTLREDGAGYLRLDIAHAKAAGAIGMGYGTRDLAKRAAGNPGFYASLYSVSDGGLVPSPGGVLIRNAEGAIIGAIGISGDTGDNDELCAVTACEACGLLYDTGA